MESTIPIRATCNEYVIIEKLFAGAFGVYYLLIFYPFLTD